MMEVSYDILREINFTGLDSHSDEIDSVKEDMNLFSRALNLFDQSFTIEDKNRKMEIYHSIIDLIRRSLIKNMLTTHLDDDVMVKALKEIPDKLDDWD